MTLPASGLMTAAMINVELGRNANDPFDINGSQERALAEKLSGPIKFSDFYGKSRHNIVQNPQWVVGAANQNNAGWIPGMYLRSDFTFQRNGNVTRSAATNHSGGAQSNISGPAAWYPSPPSGTVGDSFWVRLSNVQLTHPGGPSTITTAEWEYNYMPTAHYKINVSLPAAPGTWFQLNGDKLCRLLSTIASDQMQFLDASLTATVEFAASSGGQVLSTGSLNLVSDYENHDFGIANGKQYGASSIVTGDLSDLYVTLNIMRDGNGYITAPGDASSGGIWIYDANDQPSSGNWFTPIGNNIGDQYLVRAVTSGPVMVGGVGAEIGDRDVWLPLTSDRSFGFHTAGNGNSSYEVIMQWALASNPGVVVATATWTAQLEITSG